MLKTFADKIRRSFSDAADQYDILTSLHKEIGRELVKKVVKLNASNILDVGCGTGYVANKAKFFFPESRIIGIDIAEGMIEKAKALHEGIPIEWVCADANILPFENNAFDLVLSNLAYQWMDNLPRSFAEVVRTLNTEGVFNITLFGHRTCQELFASLKKVDPKINLRTLPSVKQVQEALIFAGFREATVDFELIKVQFKDVTDLLTWLKAIGANQLSDQQIFLGKNKLQQLQEYYSVHFPYHEGICASFEVIWVYAKKF